MSGERRRAREGRSENQKLAHEDAEGRQPRNRDDAGDKRPAEQRVAARQPADIGDLLGALHLGDMADREEDGRLGQAVHGHLQQAGEIAERAAHPEGEDDDPHVLDRRIGEHPFDVAAPVQHEGGEDQRAETERDHQRSDRDRLRDLPR